MNKRLGVVIIAGFVLIAFTAILGECRWEQTRSTTPVASLPGEIPWVLVADAQIQQEKADQDLVLPDTPWLLQCYFGGDAEPDGPVFRLEDGRELGIQISYAGYGTWSGNDLGNKFLLSAQISQADGNDDVNLESDVKIQGGDEAILLWLDVFRGDDGMLRVDAGNRTFEWEVPGIIERVRWDSPNKQTDLLLFRRKAPDE